VLFFAYYFLLLEYEFKIIEYIVFGALAKNGSFGFAKGRLVCRAKPNVPFVLLVKIVFKKCVVGKNKNTEALTIGSAVSLFTFSVLIFCFILSLIFTRFVF
jgi:hypothetical protein